MGPYGDAYDDDPDDSERGPWESRTSVVAALLVLVYGGYELFALIHHLTDQATLVAR